jgi:hypothetical protein
MPKFEASFSQLLFNLDETVTDIAIDWNRDIYLTTSSSIKLWNIDTNFTKTVVDSLQNPRKLLYSFSKRYMYCMVYIIRALETLILSPNMNQ